MNKNSFFQMSASIEQKFDKKMERRCVVCNTETRHACKNCKITFYCSKACQGLHIFYRKYHKKIKYRCF